MLTPGAVLLNASDFRGGIHNPRFGVLVRDTRDPNREVLRRKTAQSESWVCPEHFQLPRLKDVAETEMLNWRVFGYRERFRECTEVSTPVGARSVNCFSPATTRRCHKSKS